MTSGTNQPALLSRAEDMQVESWGKALVVAPHQDDESLGCGGTIALLRQAEIAVEVIFTSDGSMSHPNSAAYPTQRLVALREAEALAALQVLGVERPFVHFMRLQDSQVPGSGSTDFETAVEKFKTLLENIQPEILLLPWRLDPHKDHRATWQMVDTAIQQIEKPIRQLEYLIWLWERGAADELPRIQEANIKKVDITQVLSLKKKAIAQHLSQTTRLISDDPEGFILSPGVLAHFDNPYELFVEMKEDMFS